MKIIPNENNIRKKKIIPKTLMLIAFACLFVGAILVLIFDNEIGGIFMLGVPISLILRMYVLHRLKSLTLYVPETNISSSSKPAPFVHNSPFLKESLEIHPGVYAYRFIALFISIFLSYTLVSAAFTTERLVYFLELQWANIFTWLGTTAIFFLSGKAIKHESSVKDAHQNLPLMIFNEKEVRIIRPSVSVTKDQGIRIEDKYLCLSWSDLRSIEVRSRTGQKWSIPEIEIVCVNGSEFIIDRKFTENIEHQLLEFVSAYSAAQIILKDELK